MTRDEIPGLLERLCYNVLATLERRGHRELRGPIPEKVAGGFISWSYNHKLDISFTAAPKGEDFSFLLTILAGEIHVQVEEVAPKGNDLTKHWSRFAAKASQASLFDVLDELRTEKKPPVSFRPFDPRPKVVDNRGLRPQGVAS